MKNLLRRNNIMRNNKLYKIIHEACRRYMISEELSIYRDDSREFTLTTDWMYEMYDKFNREIFGGVLPECNMAIGKCTASNTLGQFEISKGYGVSRLYANSSTRRIMVDFGNGFDKRTIQINKENIAQYCNPTIRLSNMYKFNEYGAILVLIHEMCHYRVEYNGHYPKQAHGTEFRSVCSHVSYMTNGTISIERLLNAESVGIEAGEELVAKRQRKADSILRRLNYHLVVVNNGSNIEFLNISGSNVINEIVRYNNKRGNKFSIYKIIDNNLIEELYNAKYTKFMRTYRYWDVFGIAKLKNILGGYLNELDNGNKFKLIYTNE